MNKLLIVILLLLSSCLSYAERYQRADRRHQAKDTQLDNTLVETEAQRARRILSRRSQFEKDYMIFINELPATDIWKRRPEILENPLGDCDTAQFSIADYALVNGVNPELFRYCIMRKPNEESFAPPLTAFNYDYHAVLLFYGDVYNGEIVTTTGVLSNESFMSLEDCYKYFGYYPVVSWHKIDGEVIIYKHSEPLEE